MIDIFDCIKNKNFSKGKQHHKQSLKVNDIGEKKQRQKTATKGIKSLMNEELQQMNESKEKIAQRFKQAIHRK